MEMDPSLPSNMFIQVDPSSDLQENVKSTRKSTRNLTVLQKTDKENLVGVGRAIMVPESLTRKAVEG